MRLATLSASIGALCATLAFNLPAQGIPAPAEIKLDDSYILGVRATVDEEEIEMAQWATTHGSTKAVRDFAKSLLAGHISAQNTAQVLAYNLKIPLHIPADTDQAITRREEQQASLHRLSGAKFDRAFLTAVEVEHVREIEKVNGWYASMAASDTVKAYLHNIMPTLVKHQEGAERLLNASNKTVAVH
jgi:predicted outer membrane protein